MQSSTDGSFVIRSDIRSYFQSISNIDQKQTICKTQEVNPKKMKLNNGLVVYRLTPDKNKDLLKKTVTTSEPSMTSDSNPHKKRYLVSQKSGLVYEILQKSHLNSISTKCDAEEPESDLICDDQYFKYIGLIKSKELKNNSKTSLNEWPLRNISKIESNVKTNKSNDILLTDVCPQPMSRKTEEDVNSSENNISRRKLAKDEWREEVLDRCGQPKRCADIVSRKRDKEWRNWRIEAVNTLSEFDLSSFMGKRIFGSLFSPLNDVKKYYSIIDFENHCISESIQPMNATIVLNCFQRLVRSRNRRHFCHLYCFTRLQRLEKWRQLETGLDWRSRLMKSRCKRLSIRMSRIKKCPICEKTIELNPKHQCYEFEPHLRPQNKLCFSKPKDSSNEVIIIGDDFMGDEDMDEEMAERVDRRDYYNSNEEVIKPNDDSDDDLMIIGEVIPAKTRSPSYSVLKQLLKTQMSPKPIGANALVSYFES